MNYRQEARARLESAKMELTSGDDARLKYAALELRMSIEALTYDRALAFKDEFPPDEYQTWQPRKVMSVLLEIDPTADADSALSFGAEAECGVAAPSMQSLGTEHVLNMAAIRKHYDALGSFLHLPSMKQAIDGRTVDTGALRQRCEALAELVGTVLSSPIFNITLGTFAKIDCLRCGKSVRRRLPREHVEVAAECYECHATYSVVAADNNQTEWRANREQVTCALESCEEETFLWQADLRPDAYWTCVSCGGQNVLVLAVAHRPSAPSSGS